MAASARIMSSPLPSLPDALSRRAALFGAVTATGFLGMAAASEPAGSTLPSATAGDIADPIVPLRLEWLARKAQYQFSDLPVGEEDAAFARISAVERQVVKTRATTLLGAIASIEWVQAEFLAFKNEDLLGDRMILALLDGALDVMRGAAAAGATA